MGFLLLRHLPSANQEEIYNCTALRIVENVMNGYNGTIFAYGQTGTGKTHTMEGKDDPIDMQGITPRAFRQIFEEIKLSENKEFLVRASFLEIYNEDIRDLLGKQANNKLELKENVDTGVYVKGLTSFVVKVICARVCACVCETYRILDNSTTKKLEEEVKTDDSISVSIRALARSRTSSKSARRTGPWAQRS